MLGTSNTRCLLRASSLVAALLVLSSSAQAQYESLNPRNWFPLEAGNVWEYGEGLLDSWVVVSTIDTVVFDLTWRKFTVVRCGGPQCPKGDYWQALSDDDYPLRTSNFSRVDTLIRTIPTSFLRTTVEVDSTLSVSCNPRFKPAVVFTGETVSGNSADTTNLSKYVEELFGNIFCDNGGFIYRIGYQGRQLLQLTGAIVNGLEWGDVEFLRPVLSSETEAYRSSGIHVQSYPNPARELLTVDVRVVKTGMYDFSITTLLGQTIREGRHFILADVPATVNVRLSDVAPGLYFLRFANDVEAHFKPIVVTR